MPADCAGTAVPVTDAPEVVASAPFGWPEAVAVTPALAAIRQELKVSFDAYCAALNAQDVLLPEVATEEQEQAYQSTMERHVAAMRALLYFEPTTTAELLAKVEALQSVEADRPKDVVSDAFETLCADVQRAVAHTIRHLAPVALTADERVRSGWLTAVRRHNEARAAREEAEAVCDKLHDQAQALYPEPDLIMKRREGEFRVFTRDCMDHSPDFLKAKAHFPPSALAELELAVDTYEADCKKIDDETGLTKARAFVDQADDVEAEMRDELMRTPAPDAEAFALKLMLVQSYRSDGQLDDTDDLQEMMVSDDPGIWGAVELYKDMIRAAGLHTPAFDLPAFDAAAWIAEMESHGWLVDKYGVVCWYDPEKTLAQGPHFPIESRKYWDALKPYQRQAVRTAAAKGPAIHLPTSVLCRVHMACCVTDDEDAREHALQLAIAEVGELSQEQMGIIRADLDRFGWYMRAPGMGR